jgi:polysaccharide export outer membrane protein
VSLLDVIGLAGDLTIHGKRENVLLIRDEDGTKKLARLDLNSSDLFKSPYYYLRQNDVIYVEPSKNKVGSVNSVDRQNVSILLTAITVISLALSRF